MHRLASHGRNFSSSWLLTDCPNKNYSGVHIVLSARWKFGQGKMLKKWWLCFPGIPPFPLFVFLFLMKIFLDPEEMVLLPLRGGWVTYYPHLTPVIYTPLCTIILTFYKSFHNFPSWTPLKRGAAPVLWQDPAIRAGLRIRIPGLWSNAERKFEKPGSKSGFSLNNQI